jgi:hypothetical protein
MELAAVAANVAADSAGSSATQSPMGRAAGRRSARNAGSRRDSRPLTPANPTGRRKLRLSKRFDQSPAAPRARSSSRATQDCRSKDSRDSIGSSSRRAFRQSGRAPAHPRPTPPVFSFTEIMLDSSPYSIHYHGADRPPVRARRTQGESPPPRKPPRSPTALPFARRPLKTLKTQESEFPEISFPCRARGSWNRARRPSGARSRSALRSSAAGSAVVAATTAAPLSVGCSRLFAPGVEVDP